MEKGALVISLDFELLWGVFDKVDWRQSIDYFQNTRNVIPEILKLFDNYDISCTWASVGMLLNSDWDDWNTNLPSKLPEYLNEKLSAYKYGKSIQSRETEKLCFAPDLINIIKETPNQEIGTHTYSHYYCLENGQTPEAFRADLMKSKQLANKFQIELNSLVFPRNQFNPEYIEICREIGISTVRSNPENWYWQNTHIDSLSQKIFRTGDAYLGLNDKSYGTSEISELSNGLMAHKSSRLLRPFSGNGVASQLKLLRIRNEMTKAAKNAEIYHLWWHPHNFGLNPQKNLLELKIILEHYKMCKNQFGFESLSMSMLTEKIKKIYE